MAKGDYPEMTEFMEAAMRRVGAKTVPELCERTGLNTARHQRDFYKWLSGANRPLVTNVLPLMRATGMLSTEGAEGEAAATVSETRAPGSVGAALAALTKEIRTGFQETENRLKNLEKQRLAAAPRAQSRKRRAAGASR